LGDCLGAGEDGEERGHQVPLHRRLRRRRPVLLGVVVRFAGRTAAPARCGRRSRPLAGLSVTPGGAGRPSRRRRGVGSPRRRARRECGPRVARSSCPRWLDDEEVEVWPGLAVEECAAQQRTEGGGSASWRGERHSVGALAGVAARLRIGAGASARARHRRTAESAVRRKRRGRCCTRLVSGDSTGKEERRSQLGRREGEASGPTPRQVHNGRINNLEEGPETEDKIEWRREVMTNQFAPLPNPSAHHALSHRHRAQLRRGRRR